jgi:hypothetical protein
VLARLPAAVADDAELATLLAIQMNEGDLPLLEKAKRLGTDKAGYIAANKRLERRAVRLAQEIRDEEG